jgi:alkylation response protein AidB-like acyl-CoA dehydrogenase
VSHSVNVQPPDESDYRRHLRDWLAANLEPARPTAAHDRQREDESELEFAERSRAIQAKLFEGGFAGITLPNEFGGQGLPERYQQIFDEEAASYEMPGAFGGTFEPILGVLLAHMTTDQLQQHIPAILSGRELWSQLMSEPGAGSDIGGVTTKASRDGDECLINGQKLWTTGAHLSDFGICLTRTDWDATKYMGLTMFVVPFRSPGITIRPLQQITGAAEFCEVFLDDVRVPLANALGGLNQGWSVVQTWLTFEHGGVAQGEEDEPIHAVPSPFAESIPYELIALARERGTLGDPVVRHKIVDVLIDTATQAMLRLSMTTAMRHGRIGSHAGSALKVRGARDAQHHSQLAVTLAGMQAIAWDTGSSGDKWAESLLVSRRYSIAGGTSEVNLNNVAEKVLGLPRDPAVDRGIPFRDVMTNARRDR